LGYDVVAFEPCERLCQGAREIVAAYPKSSVVRASYGDLITAAEQGSGPLAASVLHTSFDAVLLGRVSLNYLLTESDRRALLRVVHTIAPKAPVLFGFRSRRWNEENGRLDRLRLPIRRLFELLKAPASRHSGDRFSLGAGFIHDLTFEEVQTVAEHAGYRMVYCRQGNANPYSYALLAPQ
jgi:hypothetical protein